MREDDERMDHAGVNSSGKVHEKGSRQYMTPAEKHELVRLLVADYTAKPAPRGPTKPDIIVRGKALGYDISASWARELRLALTKQARQLFVFSPERTALTATSFNELVSAIIAHYKANPLNRRIRLAEIVAHGRVYGYELSKHWSVRLRNKIEVTAPELAPTVIKPPSKAAPRKRKPKEMAKLRIYTPGPAELELFSVFAAAIGFDRGNQTSMAFSMLMKVFAHGVLSHRLNLTQAIQQARTLSSEDVLAVARVLRGIDYSIKENPLR